MSEFRRNIIGEITTPIPITWYDGIDNQNTGIHNSNATTWVDRMGTGWNFTGNINDSRYLPDIATWGDKYLQTKETSRTPNSINKFWQLGTGDFTYEAVLKVGTLVSDSYIIGIGSNGGSAENKNMLDYYTVQGFRFAVYKNNSWVICGNYACDLKNKTVVLIASRVNGVIKTYINWNQVGSGNYSGSIDVSSPMYYIGGWGNQMYCGKVYNVGLTAEQISTECRWAQNYYGIALDNID